MRAEPDAPRPRRLAASPHVYPSTWPVSRGQLRERNGDERLRPRASVPAIVGFEFDALRPGPSGLIRCRYRIVGARRLSVTVEALE